jgi:hypothetical protein
MVHAAHTVTGSNGEVVRVETVNQSLCHHTHKNNDQIKAKRCVLLKFRAD